MANVAFESKTEWHENSNWRDKGCSWFPSCLACPLEVCRYDAPRSGGVAYRQLVAGQLKAQGDSPEAIAAKMNLSRRTVYRLLANQLPLHLDVSLNNRGED